MKLSKPTADAYIRATTLMGFQDLVEDAGGDAAALLEAAGLHKGLLTKPDGLMSYPKLANLLEIASRELSRPSLALEWVLRTPDHAPNHGPLIMLARFTSTLQDWIDTGRKYWKFHTNAFDVALVDDEITGMKAFRFEWKALSFPARQLTEAILANTCVMARVVGERPHENPKLIRFQHAKPRNTDLHEQIFRCPIEFNAGHDEIIFQPDFLQHKTNGNLKLLKPLLGYYIKSRIDLMPAYDQSMSTMVSLAIPSVLGSGNCKIEYIAESLGMTSKKLQRRLQHEDTSFTLILDDVRQTMARQLLTESDAPVLRIAGMLDYSTSAPFCLAFKRWTGKTPTEFREIEQTRLEARLAE